MFDAYLKIDDIDGESTDAKHDKWIEVLSYSWGVSQPATMSASSHGSLAAERANFQDFQIVKALDTASSKIILACASGDHLKKATLEICRAGGEKQVFMKYTLTDILITSVVPGGQGKGENIPLEQVSMSYGKIQWEYTATKVQGGKGSGKVPGGWDLKTNARA